MPKAAPKSVPFLSKGAIARSVLGTVGMAGLLVSAVGPLRLPFAETLAKTYYREAVVGLLLVVALVVGLVTAVVNLFDPNQFKDQFVRYVHERTQRDLLLDGELTMRYFPKLGIESGKASLSQRRSAREFASIERSRVTLALAAAVARPHARGQHRGRGPEGAGGSLQGRQHQRRRPVARPGHRGRGADRCRQRAPAERAAAVERRAGMAARCACTSCPIDVGRLADGVPAPLVAGARVDASVANVDAKLQLKGRLMFDAADGRIELARIESRLEGKALGIDNVTLSAKGDVTALPRERLLQADNVVLSSMHKSGLAVYSTVVSAPELKFGEYRLTGNTVQIDTSVAHPDRTTALGVKVPRFEWADRALRDTTAQAQLTIKSGGAQLRVQGTSPLALALDARPTHRARRDGLERASQPSRAGQHRAGAAEGAPGDRLQAAAGARRVERQARGPRRGSRRRCGRTRHAPRWTVNADLARLDADALLSPAWLARFGDDATPFDPSMLRDVQALGRLRVGELKLGGLNMSAAVARFDIDKSVLAVEPMVAQLHGADVDGGIRIDAAAASPTLALKGSVSDLDLRGLLADVARAPWLEGRGALSWDLTAGGSSMGSLRQALAGTVSVSVKAGALAGVDLRAGLLDGKADLGKKSVAAATRAFNAQASTVVQRAEGERTVQGGAGARPGAGDASRRRAHRGRRRTRARHRHARSAAAGHGGAARRLPSWRRWPACRCRCTWQGRGARRAGVRPRCRQRRQGAAPERAGGAASRCRRPRTDAGGAVGEVAQPGARAGAR